MASKKDEAPEAPETAPVVGPRYECRTHLLHGHRVGKDELARETEVQVGEEVPAAVLAELSEAEITHHVAAGRFRLIEG